MLERDNVRFFDMTSVSPTQGIERRATGQYVKAGLARLFPGEVFRNICVSFNGSGEYHPKVSLIQRMFGGGKKIEGLPAYYEVELEHLTGSHTETLIVWSPAAWNDRFAGTAGGGTGIGGRSYLTKPDNAQRGLTVPFAVMNGFTAATMFAGNNDGGLHDYTIDPKTGTLNRELYENWRLRSTHNMTVFGKAIAELLHDRPVRWTYMNGGSGGGRQSLMEVQNYPKDYNGIWASCPAINWQKLMVSGFWAQTLMNEYGITFSAKKNQFFIDAVHEANGGADKYYHLEKIPEFDFYSCVGKNIGSDSITEADARFMTELCRGPRKADGSFLWYGFAPGVKNWQCVIPIGTYYYPMPWSRHVKPFFLAPICARWITETPGQKFDGMKIREFTELFEEGVRKFSDNLGDNPAIDAFVNAGGKLIIDHGMDDPLIPVAGTLDYYGKLLTHFGSQSALDRFMRLYITPGDSHGNCFGNGPGITEKDGMLALMKWVEEGKAPEEIRKVRVDRKNGETLEESSQSPYRDERQNNED